MNIHGWIDTVAISVGALFIPKYFRESADSPPVAEHLRGVRLEVPEIDAEGDYEVLAQTLAGELNAAFRLAQWIGADSPTVIYHHGASEIPFDRGFRGIFPLNRQEIKANLFLIRAPFHRTMKEFKHGIRTLTNFVALQAVSVCLMEHLANHLKTRNCRRILIAGTSLGGFITNLHHIHYNSATAYIPLLAGLAQDDTFLHSVYRKAVAPQARQNPTVIKSVLDLEEGFKQRPHDNVFPLLARCDRIIRYDVHKASYHGCPVATIDKGHITGALAYGQLRKHILDHVMRM